MLSALAVENAKPRDKEYVLTDGTGDSTSWLRHRGGSSGAFDIASAASRICCASVLSLMSCWHRHVPGETTRASSLRFEILQVVRRDSSERIAGCDLRRQLFPPSVIRRIDPLSLKSPRLKS
jgi:hypothetical protein